MEQVGMPFDYAMPPEPPPATHDLDELTAAAGCIANALDHLGATEIYTAHEVLYPQLDQIEGKLHNMIQGIRSQQRDTALPVQYTRGRSKLFKT